MTTPKRIQRRRTRGWRMPAGAIDVTRPGRWGNPYVVGVDGDAAECVALFRAYMGRGRRNAPDLYAEYLEPLRGHDLACWCGLDDPCHADVLLELANEDTDTLEIE